GRQVGEEPHPRPPVELIGLGGRMNVVRVGRVGVALLKPRAQKGGAPHAGAEETTAAAPTFVRALQQQQIIKLSGLQSVAADARAVAVGTVHGFSPGWEVTADCSAV